jgi:hypothetical protein
LLLVAKRKGSKEGVLQSAIRLAISIFFFFFLLLLDHGLQACGRILNDSILRFFWGVGAGGSLEEGLVVGF